jgi:class 3 adenylate cyclase/ferredoxin/hemoglobin-like flavoprotein
MTPPTHNFYPSTHLLFLSVRKCPSFETFQNKLKPREMKMRIHYVGINQEVTLDEDYCSILDASIENKIPHLHECGGNGKCSTCRVRVIEGAENLSARTQIELDMTRSRKWDPTIRLACQCYVKGDVKIQRLIWSSAEVNRLQKETAPEGKAEERPIAILFCDLRNFTALSAQNATFDIAYFLNRFYTALGDPILLNNGIIYQYVGDEIVGVFGTAGGTREKNCMDAIRAAMGMQYALDRLNKIELKDFDVKLQIGIGINFGLAYVGHLGHPTHRQFSVVGDPVNVASRIQGQTKILGASILLSKSVHKSAIQDVLHFGREFSVALAGKEETATLYELKGFSKMDLQLELQASLHLLLQNEDDFSALFYEKVFKKAPFVRRLFKNNLRDQGRLLTHMLGGIVYSLARPEHLLMGLKKLGQNHVRYGVKPEFYPVVKEAMLETIPEVLGEFYKPAINEAWEAALDFVIDAMKGGMIPDTGGSEN